jgi:D-arabinono-1,4-lactone oxidase
VVAFSARPHWEKLFTTSLMGLKSIYKKMPEFIEVRRKYDPHGKVPQWVPEQERRSAISRWVAKKKLCWCGLELSLLPF